MACCAKHNMVLYKGQHLSTTNKNILSYLSVSSQPPERIGFFSPISDKASQHLHNMGFQAIIYFYSSNWSCCIAFQLNFHSPSKLGSVNLWKITKSWFERRNTDSFGVGQVETCKPWVGISSKCWAVKPKCPDREKENCFFFFVRRLNLKARVALLPVTEAKLSLTTPRENVCQHLSSFTQQVERCEICVFTSYFPCKHLSQVGRWPNGGVPSSSTSVGQWQTQLRCRAEQQVLIQVCLPHHSFIHWEVYCQLEIKQQQWRGYLIYVVLKPAALNFNLKKIFKWIKHWCTNITRTKLTYCYWFDQSSISKKH